MISAPKEANSFPQNGAETMLDISNTFSPPMAEGEVFSDAFIFAFLRCLVGQQLVLTPGG
jgi:hypothetical protein